jgi:predicted RNase H-like nuclease (RuvC/YqgF family)
MTALERLKEKVETWKLHIEELEQANNELKAQLKQTAGTAEGSPELQTELETCRARIASLESDIADKDEEIEAIIANVEALIDG